MKVGHVMVNFQRVRKGEEYYNKSIKRIEEGKGTTGCCVSALFIMDCPHICEECKQQNSSNFKFRKKSKRR